ncbi:MAG: hypothetical protein AB7F43_13700 [Bacteriovoracia bacterium]
MRKLFFIQGLYYFVFGLWPILHISSFMAVTGEKEEVWLVKVVGSLLSISGLAFLLEGLQKFDWTRLPATLSRGLVTLAIGQALGLMIIDVFYVQAKVLSPIYWLDALVELCFVISWLVVRKRQSVFVIVGISFFITLLTMKYGAQAIQ